jgi:hypothetical protein
MVTHKTRLLILLVIEAALVALHVLLLESTDFLSYFSGWHFWPAIVGFVVLLSYALSIQCPEPECRMGQVFRGLSILNIHWPDAHCYRCGASMSETSFKIELRSTLVWIFIILLIPFLIKHGMTRAMFGAVLGIVIFSYATFGRDFWPEPIPLVIGFWSVLISVCLFAIGIAIAGFSFLIFVEMVLYGGDQPYLFEFASMFGIFGILVIVTTPLRLLWK